MIIKITFKKRPTGQKMLFYYITYPKYKALYTYLSVLIQYVVLLHITQNFSVIVFSKPAL